MGAQLRTQQFFWVLNWANKLNKKKISLKFFLKGGRGLNRSPMIPRGDQRQKKFHVKDMAGQLVAPGATTDRRFWAQGKVPLQIRVDKNRKSISRA